MKPCASQLESCAPLLTAAREKPRGAMKTKHCPKKKKKGKKRLHTHTQKQLGSDIKEKTMSVNRKERERYPFPLISDAGFSSVTK